MARFWVGNTDTWNATAASKWATTSGGAGGASIPDATQDVFFDNNSGSGTITFTASSICRSRDDNGFTGTVSLSGSTNTTIGDGTAGAGNRALRLSSTATYSILSSCTYTFVSTSATQQTVTTAGKVLPNVQVAAPGGSYLQTDALTTNAASTFNRQAGAWDTGGFNNSSGSMGSTTAGTKSLTLGATTWTCISNNTPINFAGTNDTLNPGTSTVIATANVNQCIWGGLTWYDILMNVAGSALTAAVTCHSFTRPGTAITTDLLTLSGSIICSSTFTITSNSITNKVGVVSNIYGTARTITAATFTINYADFRDITAAGAGGPITGTIIGDCGGNTNITATLAAGTPNGAGGVARYWVGNSGNSNDTTHWSTTSGGSSGASVPLPQDDIYCDVNSFSIINQRVQFNMPRIGRNIDTTGCNRSGTTIGSSSGLLNEIYGSLILAGTATVDPNATGGWSFAGRGTHTISSNGANQYGTSSINAPGGTYTLQDDFLFVAGSNKSLIFNFGTFDANGKNTWAQTYTIAATMTKVYMRSGTWTLGLLNTGSGWTMSAPAAVLDAGTSTINIMGTTTNRVFSTGGASYNIVNYTAAGSTGSFTFSNGGYVATLIVDPAKYIVLSATLTTVIGNLVIAGSDLGYQLLQSLSGNYVSVPDSAATSWSGDFDYRFKVSLDDWAQVNAAIAGKQTTGSTGVAWSVSMNSSTKQPTLQISSNGTSVTAATSTAAVPFSNGSTDSWLRVTWRASDGRVQFFTSSNSTDDPSVPTWTQLGTDRTINVGSIFDSPASILLGALNTTNSPVFSGKYYRAQFRNNILDNGTGIQLDVDFTTKTIGLDTFTESSSNAATVSIVGANAQVGDGRILLTSSTGAQAFIELPGAINQNLDYLVIRDVVSAIGGKFFAGTHSILVSGTENIVASAPPASAISIYEEAEASSSTNSLTATFQFGRAAVAGQQLVAFYSTTSNPGTVTTPSGYTLDDTTIQGTSVYMYRFKKIAVGGETSVTVATTNTITGSIRFYAAGGFTGTPTVDVMDENSSATATALATNGTNPSNTANPALALAAWAGSNTLGASVSLTNSFQEQHRATNLNYLRAASKLLTSNAAVNTTYTWTTSRAAVDQLVVIKDVSAATGNFFPFFA